MVMTGLIYTKNGSFIFRDDHGHGKQIWAWDIYDDYNRGMTHKWNKMPKGFIIVFDIDNPPSTISYIPIIN